MKILIFLLNVFVLTTASASDFPDIPFELKFFGINSDSGIHGPRYAQIVEELKDLGKTYENFAQVITYGKSVGGKPLTLIKISDKSSTRKIPAIYIGGSIHGDEYLNIEDRLPRWFLEQTASNGTISNYLKRGGVIYVAPILNPDGYDKRARANNKGIDLNRDYTVLMAQTVGFTQPETSTLIKFLKEDLENDKRKLEVAMDYHCCIGALLYPWSFTGPVLQETDMKRHTTIADIMQAALGRDMKHGQTPVILGYSAKGTSKDFYFEEFGARGFTYEGRRGQEDKFFDEHTVMWTNIIQSI
ncbi:MAG TPA: M14 family metallopeptidase [Bacteriovoracaceae bacterium]|nr:M14 family metallopeptidase [Bacteriovoracaceae bacterium]